METSWHERVSGTFENKLLQNCCWFTNHQLNSLSDSFSIDCTSGNFTLIRRSQYWNEKKKSALETLAVYKNGHSFWFQIGGWYASPIKIYSIVWSAGVAKNSCKDTEYWLSKWKRDRNSYSFKLVFIYLFCRTHLRCSIRPFCLIWSNFE